MLRLVYLFSGALMIIGALMTIYSALTGKVWMLRGKAEDLLSRPNYKRNMAIQGVVFLLLGLLTLALGIITP